jgi:hypothetical protein
MLKYLRNTVTALSLTACVLLVALWVRSYWIFSETKWVLTSQSIDFRSYHGEFGVTVFYRNRVFERTFGRVWGVGTWHSFEKGWQAGTYFYWPVLLSLFVAASAWFPWSKRFRLRTLLIAMTLVAVALGAMVYAVRFLIYPMD